MPAIDIASLPRGIRAALVLLVLAPAARADDVVWTNGSGNFTWNATSLNWNSGAWNNARFDGAIFDTTGVGTITVTEPITVRGINFAAPGYSLTGPGPLVFSTAGTSTLAASTISVAAGTATVSAPLMTPFGLNVVGAGTLNLGGTGHAFTGRVPIGDTGVAVNLQVGGIFTSVGDGTLALGSANVLPAGLTVGVGHGTLDIGSNNVTLGNLVFNRSAFAPSTPSIMGSGTLTVAGEIRVVGGSIGGINHIASGLNLPTTLTVRANGRDQSGLAVTGVISGPGGLFKTHYVSTSGGSSEASGITLYANNTYTGPTTISAFENQVAGTNASPALTVVGGSLTLLGSNGSFDSVTTVRLVSGGSLVLSDNTAIGNVGGLPPIAAATRTDRIAPTAALSAQGGGFRLEGRENTPASQQLARVDIERGHNTFMLRAGIGLGNTAVLRMGDLSIAPGATAHFLGFQMSTTDAAAPGRVSYLVSGARPAEVGGIIVGAVGNSSDSGTPTDFVRYVAANNIGIARLAASEYTTNFTTPNANVSANFVQSVDAPVTINSLRAGGFLTLNADLTVATGMILNPGTIDGPGTLRFGSSRGYFFGSGPIQVPVVGTGGITKAVDGVLNLSGDLSGLSGGIVVQSGTLRFSNSAATRFAGPLDFFAGTVQFNAVDEGTGTLSIGDPTAPAQASVARAFVELNASSAVPFARPIHVRGNGGAQRFGLSLVANGQTLSGPITLDNNLSITGGVAATNSTFAGPITGAGGLFVSNFGTVNLTSTANQFNGELELIGTGTVNLAGSVNAGTGGTTVRSGTLRVAAANNLASGPVSLLGGTFAADAAITLPNTVSVAANTTVVTGANNLTLAGPFNGSQGTVTKTGTGTLTMAAAGDFAGGIALGTGAGTLTISGNGALPRLGGVTLGRGTTFNVNDSATAVANRTGFTTNLSSNTAGASGVAPVINLMTNAAGSAFRFGNLTVTGGTAAQPNATTLNFLDAGAGTHSATFLSLTAIAANNSLAVVGSANLGTATPGVGSRIFFVTPPTLTGGVIANMTFTGFGGSGPATYDPVLGLIRFAQTTGSFIDNITNVGQGSPTPVATNFLTNAATTANLGATIKTLTVAGHAVNLVPGVYGPQAGNANAPANTLVLTDAGLNAITTTASINASAPAVIQFGPSGATLASFSTATNLTVGANVTVVTTGGLLKTGAGTLTLTGQNAITGNYTVTGGTLALPAGGSSASTLTGSTGTGLNLGGGPLTLAGPAGAATTFAGSVSGAAGSSLTLAAGNAATQTLSGPNSFTGPVAVNGGTLVAAHGNALGNAANAVDIGTGGTLGFSGSVGIGNANPVTIRGAGAAGRAGAIDSLGGINSFAGPITLAADATLGVSQGTLTLSGGLSGPGRPTFNTAAGATLALTGVPLNLGTDTFIKSGAGTLVLPNAANTFSNINVPAGLVSVAAENNLGAPTTPVNLSNGGGLQFTAPFAVNAARPLTLGAGGGTLDTLGNAVVLNSTTTGAGSLTKTGTGTLTLNAPLTHSGGTVVAAGALIQGVANALPAGSTLTIGNAQVADNTSSVQLNGNDLTVAGLTFIARGAAAGGTVALAGPGVLTVNGPIRYERQPNGSANRAAFVENTVTAIDLGGAVRTITVESAGNSTGDLIIDAPIRNGGLIINGSNLPTNPSQVPVVELSAANTFAGGLTVNAGTVIIPTGATTGAFNNRLTVAGTAPLSVATVRMSSTQFISNLTGAATADSLSRVEFGQTLFITQSLNTSYGGRLSGTGNLSVGGAGTLTLLGFGDYQGTTEVGGQLAVNGTLDQFGGLVSVFGTLSGSGTIRRPVLVSSGGRLAPGNSPGTFTASGGLTLGSGSRLVLDIFGDVTAGADYDQLLLGSGALTINGAAVSADFGSFMPSPSTSITVVAGAGSISGQFLGGTTVNLGAYTATAIYGPNSIIFTGFTPVPEPACVLAIAATVAAAAHAVRRRRSSAGTPNTTSLPNGN